jgi:hypothetical protein
MGFCKSYGCRSSSFGRVSTENSHPYEHTPINSRTTATADCNLYQANPSRLSGANIPCSDICTGQSITVALGRQLQKNFVKALQEY